MADSNPIASTSEKPTPKAGRRKNALGKWTTTHGLSRTPEYQVWVNMMRRCYDESDASFQSYGKRGIRVSEDWHSLDIFVRDMGCRPSAKHTLERVKNSLGYSKENCRWETRKRQGNNKRNNHILSHRGESHTLAEWAGITGLQQTTIRMRLTYGWSVKDALTRPLLTSRRPKRPGTGDASLPASVHA